MLSLPQGTGSPQAERDKKMEEIFNRAIVMGCACVIFSKLTCEQYEMYRQYHPEALKLINEDDQVNFSVDLEDGPGHIETDATVFSRTRTPDGKATITVVIDPEEDNKAELIKKHFGAALLRLDELEEQLLLNLPGLKEEAQKVEDMISRIG